MSDFFKLGVGLAVVCGFFIALIASAFVLKHGCSHADTVASNALFNYEEFQEIYNTTQKLNTDLCAVREVPDNDTMFEQFSKSQRVTGLRANLARWVNEYNAKSKMWNRALWKSSSLPYELTVAQFSCY